MDAAQHTPGAGMRLLVFAAGFGCLAVLMYVISQGFDASASGIAEAIGAQSTIPSQTALALSRIAVLILLAIAGWFRWFSLNRVSWIVVSVALFASCMAMPFTGEGVLGVVVYALAGISSGVIMFGWMMLASTFPVKHLVHIAMLGLLLAGVLVAVLQVASLVVLVACLAFLCLACAAVPLALDPGFESMQADGPVDMQALAHAQWLPIFVFLVCGIFSIILYRSAFYTVSLFSDTNINSFAFGISAACGVLLTCGIMMQEGNWQSAVWAPLFVLFLMADVFACFATHAALNLAVGLLLGCVLTFSFLRFVVFPAFLYESGLPRAFLSAVFLLLGNGMIARQIGIGVASAVPVGLRGMASIAGVAAVVLLAILGFAVLVVVMRLNAPLSSGSSENHEEALSPEEAIALRLEQLAGQYDLTQREIEVAQLSAQGFHASYIAERLVISQSTVRFHQQNVYRKLNIHSRAELIEMMNLSLDDNA